MRKALGILFVTGLFVLLLSALIVTPESACPPSAPKLPDDLHAVFLPAVPPSAADPADVAEQDWRPVLSSAFFMAAFTLPRPALRDANGHVLTAVRYENSVYQLFRPEVAGG